MFMTFSSPTKGLTNLYFSAAEASESRLASGATQGFTNQVLPAIEISGLVLPSMLVL